LSPQLEMFKGTLDLMVLRTLEAMGAMHGFGIARRIEQVSGESILLNQGTIYASLVRLQQRGLIRGEWGISDNNRKAKFYSITKRGAKRLAEAARTGKAKSDELSGSTLTLSSLGPLGGIAATPVINRPEVAIIGPNKVVERPIVRDGQIVIAKMMNLSVSCDHRVVDGHDAASFVQAVKKLVETPALLFVD